MRPEDLEQYRQHFPHWTKLLWEMIGAESERQFGIGLLSGDTAQYNVLSDCFGQEVACVDVTRRDWDLNEPGRVNFDLIVGMNVFMYSPDPDLWFRNVFARCRFLWIQDPVCGKRGPVELGDGPTGDGDAMRYGFDPLLKTRLPNGYD